MKYRAYMKQMLKLGVLTFVALVVTAGPFGKVYANHTESGNNCGASIFGSPSETDASGSGYIYVTIQYDMIAPANSVGHTYDINCTLGRGNGELQHFGRNADRIWFGPRAENISSYAPSRAQQCVLIPPTDPGTVDACSRSDGTFAVFQDDAAKIEFNGSSIHCHGMAELCDPANGGDVYADGVEPDDAIRGAGFFNLSNPVELTNVVGKEGDNSLSAISMRARVRNTWSGNNRAVILFTLRIPKQGTPPCPTCPDPNEDDDDDGDGGDDDDVVCPLPGWDDTTRTVSLDNQGLPDSSNTQQHSYTNVTDVQSVRDQWGQLSDYDDDHNNSVEVDYNPHIQSYPYDYHTPRIEYYVHYQTDHYDRDETTVPCPTPTDPARTCTNVDYDYSHTTQDRLGPFFKNADELPPCFNRNFKFTPTANAPRFDDPEEPTRAIFNTTMSTEFTLRHGLKPLREQLGVNFTVTGSYTIKRANGTTSNYPLSKISGTFPGNNRIGNYPVPQTVSRNFEDIFNASIPPLQAGDQACYSMTMPAEGEMAPNGDIIGGAGSQTISRCSPPLVDRPYLRVYGGDVMAGGGFGESCSITSTGEIIAYNKNNGEGSAVQFAAQALGEINGFTSATGRTAPPQALKGLSFANSITSDPYGGNYGAGLCTKDYFAEAPDTGVPTSYVIETGRIITPGTRSVVYVDGNAYIRGNVQFAGNGTWATLQDIPTFYLIARGDIYIESSVSQLDGVYIAQGGKIFTCAIPGGTELMAPAQPNYDTCRNKLTINGAFIANEVKFHRTNGSIRNSTANEGSASSSIAEVFNYSPEVFLRNPGIYRTPQKQYESISSLPPVL